LAAFSFLCLLFATPALGQEEEESAQAYESMAVQNRLYSQTGEFSAFVGMLPLDAFTKGLTLSGAYTQHFSDLIGWEIVHAFYSFHLHTGLWDDLEVYDLKPTPFEVLENTLLTTNLVLTPIYWKGSWLNNSLLHGEMMIFAGGGYGWFTRSKRVAVDLGLGVRFYASRVFSFRLEVRHHIFFNSSIFEELDLHHELWTGLGASASY
jgi:outer membrane beta-barrel protein